MPIEDIKRQVAELSRKTAFTAAALALAAGGAVLAGCSSGNNVNQNSGNSGSSTSVVTQSEESATGYDFSYSKRDLDPSYDESSVTRIQLNGSTATVEGSGADVNGDKITITDEGVYVLSGAFLGTVDVSAPDTAKVQIVLSGAHIEGQINAISANTADKVFITLEEGSENLLSNSTAAEDGSDNDAVIWSNCDLTLQGNGSLTVRSINDGIKTQDDLAITGGNYSVDAADDGIVGHDSVKMTRASVNVVAADGDGIKSSQSDKEYKGFVSIDDGNVNITSRSDDGISAATHVRVAGGEIAIISKDKGIVSDNTVEIQDGKVSIDAGGDGVHAEFGYTHDGGNMTVSNSNEGIEGQVIEINAGNVYIVSNDDGINASKGDTAEEVGTPLSNSKQNDPMGNVSEECKLVVNGGNVYVDAAGDGLDSNGTIELNGGTVAVNGPANDGNGALDSGIGIYASGSSVIAIGSAGMFEGFSSDSSSVFIEANVSVKSGDIVTVADGDKVLASVRATKSAAIVTASSPNMVEGKEYQIIINGNVAVSDAYGCAFEGTVTDGTSATAVATKQSNNIGMGKPGGMRSPSEASGFQQGQPAPGQIGEESGQPGDRSQSGQRNR